MRQTEFDKRFEQARQEYAAAEAEQKQWNRATAPFRWFFLFVFLAVALAITAAAVGGAWFVLTGRFLLGG